MINLMLILGAFIGFGMMAEARPFGEWGMFTLGVLLLSACLLELFS